jgi:hypothetical protein
VLATLVVLAAGALVAFTLPFAFPTRRPLRLPIDLTVQGSDVRIGVTMPAPGRLRVSVRRDGEEVAVVTDARRRAGRVTVTWRAPDPGRYTAAVQVTDVRQPYRNRRPFHVGVPGEAPG